MNTYRIQGRLYKATNEYEAVKQAYKMAGRVEMVSYIGFEMWQYAAYFKHGVANLIVTRVFQ